MKNKEKAHSHPFDGDCGGCIEDWESWEDEPQFLAKRAKTMSKISIFENVAKGL